MDTTSLIQIPGYRYNEYLLVLSPHQELLDKIKKIKEDFSTKYKCENARWGLPHVALVNFIQFQMLEERIVNRLKIVAMGYHPIKVELKDFGSFPSHTIYINVTSKLPIQNLVKEIRQGAQQLMKLNNDSKPHFIMEPYLAIARKLRPWQYEQGWLEYSHKRFTEKFIADTMLLLKRPVGEKKYQVVQRFQFQNLPIATKQGQLFM